MKLNRRNFIKGAISAIVAAICKVVPKSRMQADPRKIILDSEWDIPRRSVQLMPRWDISADEVRARIDTLREQPQGGYVVPEWLHDDIREVVESAKFECYHDCRCVLNVDSPQAEGLVSWYHDLPERIGCQCVPIPTWDDDVIDSGALLTTRKDLSWLRDVSET